MYTFWRRKEGRLRGKPAYDKGNPCFGFLFSVFRNCGLPGMCPEQYLPGHFPVDGTLRNLVPGNEARRSPSQNVPNNPPLCGFPCLVIECYQDNEQARDVEDWRERVERFQCTISVSPYPVPSARYIPRISCSPISPRYHAGGGAPSQRYFNGVSSVPCSIHDFAGY